MMNLNAASFLLIFSIKKKLFKMQFACKCTMAKQLKKIKYEN